MFYLTAAKPVHRIAHPIDKEIGRYDELYAIWRERMIGGPVGGIFATAALGKGLAKGMANIHMPST
ncbi:MAG TPA: hypothetical protein VG291_13325 [Xanthobacteraceae bacterium]|nr:hypothetical protein [Xanthobacteraceae bacterium]